MPVPRDVLGAAPLLRGKTEAQAALPMARHDRMVKRELFQMKKTLQKVLKKC